MHIRGRRRLDILLMAGSIVFLLAAIAVISPHLTQGVSYRKLSNETIVDAKDEIDWESLQAQNKDVAAWLTVEGTNINYPMVKPSNDKPGDWYLCHDFWGNDSYIGCPYLDRRSEARGKHLLVYGHHLTLSGQMFSSIYDAYKQDRFNQIGIARWSTPTSGITEFMPAMAMSVDKGYAPIQTFEFGTTGEMRTWLEEMSSDATAASPNLDALIDNASRILTLVTCSNPISGQRERTLLICIA